MKLHILSDLHLSASPFDVPMTAADVVVLAGDIARPKEAIQWAKQIPKPVIYVPGNHEFYGSSIAATIHELKQLSRHSNVHVLCDDALEIEGVRFLGTTLWTDFLLFGETGKQRDLAIDSAMQIIRDFSRITGDDKSGELFTPQDSVSQFSDHSRWLESQLAEPFLGSTVVITHHSPSPRSIHPRFADSPLNACFVSEAEWLLGGERVTLWVHGHTHDSFDYSIKGTRVVCNPRGYAEAGINENLHFDPNFIAELV
ncbi:metallophosphoesterase [Neptunomonas japonica]|uniref:Metallophosphoesterase n=1 Tax=Neptunomonas japonica JAMM 1380 TaxID=1441457 RepID=A0A7R6PQP4_9GAMM|nr:metallophosphoesterase [Neptunomonas japonica]BBB30837.1 metallophosphoesterase [Neptunomonas japonica JAMM 1380]